MFVSMFSIGVSAQGLDDYYDWKNQNLTNATLAAKINLLTIEEKLAVKKISLHNNEGITDLSAVFENFPNLTTLHAPDCKIDNLSGIENLSQLILLNLRNNNIVDVTPIGNLGYAIQQLVLANNKISNYEPLIIEDTGSNTHIYGLLDLSDNYISNTDLFSYLSVDEGLDEDLLDLNDSLPQLFFNSYDSITQTTDDVIQTIIDQTILNYMVDLVDDVNLDVLKTAIETALYGI